MTSMTTTKMTMMNRPINNTFNFMDDHEISDGGTTDSVVALIFYALILVLGMPGNAIIIQAYAWKKRKTSTDILIMGQAIVDFIACGFSPAHIIRSGYSELLTIDLCLITSFSAEAIGCASMTLTTAIGINRYVVVCHPQRRRLSIRGSIIWVLICVVIAVALVTPLVSLIDTELLALNGQMICSYEYMDSPSHAIFMGLLMIYVTLFVVSFVTVTLCYALIYAFLRKRAKIHADLVSATPEEATTSINTGTSRSLKPNPNLGPLNMTTSETVQVIGNAECSSHTASTSYASTDVPQRTVIGFHVVSRMSEEQDSFDKSLKLHLTPANPTAPSEPASIASRRDTANRPVIRENKKMSDYGRKTTLMLVIITIYFFVTWIPQLFIPIFSNEIMDRNTGIPGFTSVSSVIDAVKRTNHVINFFIYYFVSNFFRQDVHKSFKRCLKFK